MKLVKYGLLAAASFAQQLTSCAELSDNSGQEVMQMDQDHTQNLPQLEPTIYNSSAPNAQEICPGYVSNHIVKVGGIGFTALLELNGEPCNAYGTDIGRLGLSVQYQSQNRLAVTIIPTDLKPENETYYDLPEDIVHKGHVDQDGDPESNDLIFEHGNEPSFWFRVKRRENNEILFSTKGSKLVYENQFIEFKTELPSGHNLYGLGETVNDFKLHAGSVRTMHNADIPDLVNANLYGTHPFYVEHRYDSTSKGSAHGVYLRNAHAQEVKIDDDSLTWRALGGAVELTFFSGPSTKEVVKQYQKVVGLPVMHQYWTLGYHHSRWGIKSAEELYEVAENYKNAGIPLETMWSDLDYMSNRRDFTLDPENYPADRFGAVLDKLHKEHRHYVPLVDAAIHAASTENDPYPAYSSGVKADVFVKNPDGSDFVGDVWPGHCVFPDWLAFNTPNWWYSQLKQFHDVVPYDGVWLDMNEVSSFCTGEQCSQYKEFPSGPNGVYHDGKVAEHADANARNLRFPPYVINNTVTPNEMGARTMPMEAVHAGGIREYDWHNLWGYQICRNTYNALVEDVIPNKRPFLITRSSYAGTGSVAGHWGGDNFAEWKYLRYSISQGLSFSLFGIPMFGTDACGFHGAPDDHEEMCNRWSQLNAFFSFYRNHNDENTAGQEFYLWDSVAEAARKAMDVRYRLLPYMYTLLQNAHERGETWLRALSWEFQDDESLAAIDSQFMVGPSIMVAPVLDQGRTSVEATFPNARWYDWYSHEEVVISGSNNKKTIDAPLGHIPVYIRGGSVLALQEPGLTTHESRQGEWQIIVALDESGNAEGELYLDDGESVQNLKYSRTKFSVEGGKQLKVETEGHYDTPKLSKITVIGRKAGGLSSLWGANEEPKVIYLDNENWLHDLEVAF